MSGVISEITESINKTFLFLQRFLNNGFSVVLSNTLVILIFWVEERR